MTSRLRSRTRLTRRSTTRPSSRWAPSPSLPPRHTPARTVAAPRSVGDIQGVRHVPSRASCAALDGDGIRPDSEIGLVLGRYYQYGAAGAAPRHRRPPAHRPVHDVLAHQGRQAGLRAGLGRDRQRLGDRHQDLRQRRVRRHRRQAAEDAARAGQGQGLQDRRHHDVRAPGRHPRPSRSRTSRRGPATARWPPARPARRPPSRTVASARSPSSCSTRPDVTLGGGPPPSPRPRAAAPQPAAGAGARLPDGDRQAGLAAQGRPESAGAGPVGGGRRGSPSRSRQPPAKCTPNPDRPATQPSLPT